MELYNFIYNSRINAHPYDIMLFKNTLVTINNNTFIGRYFNNIQLNYEVVTTKYNDSSRSITYKDNSADKYYE